MNKIIHKEFISDKVVKIIIQAPEIARNRKPGHFVIIRVDNKGERIPLTIADADIEAQTITLIVQEVGVTSAKLIALNPGEYVLDIVGPLGQATKVHKTGTILAAGGGVGIAPLYPIVKAFKEAGNKVITVLAARTKDLLILEKEMSTYSDELIIMTDDGSYGQKGLVTNGMESVMQREKIDESIIIGPAIMMKFASISTKKFNVPTQASLNTIMVDGTGMCGACRVTVNGETKFVCIDGPEFDAHQVDFDLMLQRLNAYKTTETKEYEKYLMSKTL